MIAIYMESSKERELSLDIRRTVILGAYIREWKMPEYRIVLSKPETAVHVEVYYFPADAENEVARFATVGLSVTHRPSGQAVGTEWVMALTSDLGGESVDRIFTYLCDLIAHHIESAGDSRIPRVMEESPLAPANWTTTAFLLDELRGKVKSWRRFRSGARGLRSYGRYQSRRRRLH